MADFSFDVVSKMDMTLIEESIQVALKEITNRYDFKGTNSTIELNRKDNVIKLASSDEYKIKALYDVLQTRLSKRGISLKNLQPGKIETALGATAKQEVKVQQGIPADKAKEIQRVIKDSKLKVTASIQGDQLRIVSASKDALQSVMGLLGEKDFGLELQFVNLR